ncbi:MAG TPA: TIGR01777 family oxidoreductase [Acidimicrobiales bacterium]|nr:TIGR01777 family oxidoreductase [Acidimicrobiales bacterium]
MQVALTGSGGLIGSALAESLIADGVDVLRLRRGVHWDPGGGTVEPGVLAGVDAVVHLAGEGVAEKRWSAEQKERIRDSRVVGTRAIAAACASDGVATLVSGSAIGFYGALGEAFADETAPGGIDFLARVVVDWEAATEPAERAGIRVVHARTGIVQSARGGMLKQQLQLFKLGLGGRIGKGDFYVSWVSLQDEVRALRFAVDNQSLSGAVNITAPNPVTNAEWTKALGRAVHRPAVLVVPPAALRLALGAELVASLLASQRVMPRRLVDAGFVFHHPTIDEGLAWAVSA